ncbi:MAG: hypothetical protein KAG99_10685 [Bacteroidales bacterium]|nr:hypothetical protein [Bacteroidales bacterium]
MATKIYRKERREMRKTKREKRKKERNEIRRQESGNGKNKREEKNGEMLSQGLSFNKKSMRNVTLSCFQTYK